MTCALTSAVKPPLSAEAEDIAALKRENADLWRELARTRVMLAEVALQVYTMTERAAGPGPYPALALVQVH